MRTRPLTNRQKRLLHAAARWLGLDEDTYREILRQEAGVETSLALDQKGLDRVLRRFEQLGFKPSGRAGRRRHVHFPGELPTPDQLALIEHLYEDLGWWDRRRQIGFNRRACGRPWPQTREEANKVIEGLKAMLARKG